LGNLDTHRIPQGYDLVVSIHGSFHALDQVRVLEQVLDSLNVGGEAFYTRPLHDAAKGSVLDSYRVKNYLQAENGIVFTENPTVGSVDFKPVYLKKTNETPPAQELLAKAQQAAKDPKYGGFYYQIGGAQKRYTPEGYPQDVKAALIAFVLQKGYLSKAAAKEIPAEFLEFFSKAIQSDLQAGFTLEQAVARGEDVVLRDLPGVKRPDPSAPTPREPGESKPEVTQVEKKNSTPTVPVENPGSTGDAPIPAASRSEQGQRVVDRIFETPARDSTSDASPGSRKKGVRKTEEGEEVPVARTTRGELDPAFPAGKIQEERPLQPGEYVIYTGEKLSVLSFSRRFNQRQMALPRGDYLQFRVDPSDGSLSVAYFGKGDLVIRDAQGDVGRFRGSNPGQAGHFEKLASGETILTHDQKVKIQSEADVAAELKVRGEIRVEREKIDAMRAELEKSRARGDDPTKIQEQEKTLAAAELAFRESLAKRQRTVDGEPYAEVMPQVVQDIAGGVFDGFFPKDGGETGLFDGQGRVLPEARIELRNKILAELERRGIRISTDNVKSVDSILDLALTAKQHGIIDKPGGLTRTQFFELVGELYLHNHPELRIGAAELTHVPMVVAGTLDHYEVAMRGQGKKTRVADKKALFIAALLHDAGKWDGKIKTETGFTILKTSPFNKTGADIVAPPGRSLQEVLAEQKIDPALVPLPFDGMVAILVHHDASNVHAEVERLVKQGLLSPGEGEQAWQAIQYHGFVSSWIMKNSLGGLGIKSHVFDAAFDKNLVPYLEAYQRVSQRLGEKGVPDLETLMQEPQMAADVATMREAFRKLPPYVQALMLGDHQGQIDAAKYMTILSGVPANKDASIYELFFGESMGNSLMGVLQTHRFEELFHSLTNGQLAESAFVVAQSWLLQSDPKQAGLAQAILKDPELAASFEAWQKAQPGEVTVQDWLKTLKVKSGAANSPEFVKIQKRVEAAFYEFYALGTEHPLDWREQAGLAGPPPPLSWEADVARKDRHWGDLIVGKILEYYSLPDTRGSLEAMAAKQDALGEQARNFHRDLKNFEALVLDYRRLEKDYEQKPSPEKLTVLDQKWAEIDAKALQLDASPYHTYEKEHGQEILTRVRGLEPLQQVLAIAQVQSSQRKKLHPDKVEDFHYSIDYTAVENLTQYAGNWSKAPTKELLRFEGTVADWSVAEKILAEIQSHPGLKIVKGFLKSADGNSATVTVQVDGEQPHEVEISFRLVEAKSAIPLPSGAQPVPSPASDDKTKRPAAIPLPAAAAGSRGTTSRLQDDIPTGTSMIATPYGKAYLAMDEVNPDRLEAYRLLADSSAASVAERLPEGVSATVVATRWHPGEKGGSGRVEVFLKFGKTYRFRDNAVLHLSLEAAEALKIPVNKDGAFHGVSPQTSPQLFLAAEQATQVKPQAQAAVLAFEARRKELYREIPSAGMMVGRSGKSYSAREIEQLLYQVLERNQPLTMLPNTLRPKVREYMRQVVAEAMSLFPEAGIGTAEHNYFTGESLKKRYQEMDISGDYRFARMLLNQKAGLPIFGEPSAAEQKDLLGFVQEKLAIPHVKTYEEARALLREQVFKMDPAVRQALQEADPKLRNLVVDALFGDGQTLRVKDARQAVAVAQFLGKLGFHREFSVSYNLGTQPPHAVLRLGDLTQVAQEPGEILFFHTHPVHLTDVRGGRRQGIHGNTLVLDYSEAKERSHSALFSDGDIDCFTHEASRLFNAGPNLKLPFYDAQNRVYKNWVQHSTGISEIEVHLDSQGKVQAIKIRSGLYEGVDAGGFAEQQRELQTYIRSKYGLDATIEGVAPSEIETSLRAVAEPGSAGPAVSGEGLEGMKEGSPPVQGSQGSSDQVSVQPNWEVLTGPLARHQVALKDLNANATEVPVYAGDPAKLPPGTGTRLVVQDGIHTEEPIYWGTFRREGDTWVFYPGDNPQAQDITDGMFFTKGPRADGAYVLNDQDRVSLGFAAFQLRDGVLVSQEKPGSGLQLSLHPDPNTLGGARGAPADYVDPVFTHVQPGASPEIFSGNVDYSRGIPVHVTPASAQSGEVAMSTTQGRGKKGPSEDAILKLHGPKGELVVLDIDGIGGLANGDAAAVLAAEAFAAEYGRSGDSQRAWQFANVAIQRFNGEFKASLPKKKPEEISQIELAAAKKAGLAAARKMIADPAAGITGAMSDGSGAVAVELKVLPSEKPGDPHVVKFSWVGDARGMVLRRQSNGEWKWVYRTVDQGVPNRPGESIAGVDYDIGGEGRTLMAALHPQANVVTNSLGSNPIAKPQGMEHGEIPDAREASGASPAGIHFTEGATLQKGDLALLGSDGFWENFGHTKIILELVKHADSAEVAVKTLSDEAHWRMGIMEQARRRQLPEVIPGLYRFERPEGILYVDAQGKLKSSQVLYINGKGAVYETPDSQNAVDHYKTDHFSLVAYQHVPVN